DTKEAAERNHRLGLLAEQAAEQLEDAAHRFHTRRGTLAAEPFGPRWIIPQGGPGHLVACEVELDAETGQDVVADDAVQFRPGQPQAVHPLQLKRILNAPLD